MKKSDQQLADTIAEARRAKGISTRTLAGEVGIDQSNIVRLERGSVATPNPAVLGRIAQVLNLDVADLYALAGYTRPSELPAFTPYLRSKFGGLPEAARAEIEQSFRRIADKYGYAADGPAAGEDEH